MEKYYYGVFNEEEGKVLVSVPDVEICETFGDTWEEAFEMAVDALAACISTGSNNVKNGRLMKKWFVTIPLKK